jgi:hypothetical protein
MSQFHTSIATRKLPGDSTTRSITLHLQSIDTPSQGSDTGSAAGQTPTLKNTNFDFGHIQPTVMLVFHLSPDF